MVGPSVAAAHDHSPLVLFVDDDADTREMCALLLTSAGFTVDTAADGNEALGKATTTIPDVVVTDILLPRMDGFALCREIRRDERTARIPVIGVTGYSTDDRLEQAERAGFNRLLLKPVAPNDLIDEIRRMIATTRRLLDRSVELHARSAALCDEIADVLRESADVLQESAHALESREDSRQRALDAVRPKPPRES